MILSKALESIRVIKNACKMNSHVFDVWTDSHLEYLDRWRVCFQKFYFPHYNKNVT